MSVEVSVFTEACLLLFSWSHMWALSSHQLRPMGSVCQPTEGSDGREICMFRQTSSGTIHNLTSAASVTSRGVERGHSEVVQCWNDKVNMSNHTSKHRCQMYFDCFVFCWNILTVCVWHSEVQGITYEWTFVKQDMFFCLERQLCWWDVIAKNWSTCLTDSVWTSLAFFSLHQWKL